MSDAGTGAAPSGGSAAPDLGAPTVLVLLRHGETALTAGRRFSGSGGADPALSERGREQAAGAARALAAAPGTVPDTGTDTGTGTGTGTAGLLAVGAVEAVVSSPLARCRQTAGVVAERLGLTVELAQDLRETAFGAWEGLTFAEVRERYPAQLAAWFADPTAAPPGGESFAEVTARVAAARDALLAAHRGRTVLVVSHVTPVKTLLRLALGAPPQALFRMDLAPASLSAVAYYTDGNASVRFLNSTAHLPR
ncbi:histidine phosphatase family protein [Streptomyces sp. PRB2-1]|uniref:Histidine phosphatase family protein n=1 Tax=Actinacidiphila epipremni TaxID=2053013 RepID=A0ABX0ZLM1_9ACTN|nr:histidine phosphatase family protein [Actinacidiphila epipremni]